MKDWFRYVCVNQKIKGLTHYKRIRPSKIEIYGDFGQVCMNYNDVRNVNTNKNYDSNHLNPLALSWVSTSSFCIATRYQFLKGRYSNIYRQSKLNHTYLYKKELR